MADQSYRMGRILGIDLELHWTFLALLFVTLLLSSYVFILIVLLFICVLIHELAHSIVAIKNKVEVRKIILLPMGGVSIINQTHLKPEVEFNMAISGPLMSMFLGCVFGIFAAIAPPGMITQTLQFLFQMNILLGVFNILPVFPTDGGRVFRSYMEKKHDEYKATMLTIKVSKCVLLLFIIGTLTYLLLLNAPLYYKEFVFLWNLLIVFFFYSSTKAEEELAEIKIQSKGVGVKEVVSDRFCLVEPDETVQALYETVCRTRKNVLITKMGSDYAYVNLLDKEKIKRAQFVRDLAEKIPCVSVKMNVIDAFMALEPSDFGIAAVTDGDKLAGILTTSHLRAFLALHMRSKKR